MEQDFVEVTPDRMKEVYVPSKTVNNILMSEDKPLNCLQRKQIEERHPEGRITALDTPDKALDIQVDGDHYKRFVIQPVEFCQKNKLDTCQSNVIKYICRHNFKDGLKDLQKAKHYIDLLIQMEYKDVANERVPTQ